MSDTQSTSLICKPFPLTKSLIALLISSFGRVKSLFGFEEEEDLLPLLPFLTK